MAIRMEDDMQKYSFWDFKGQADYVDSWFIMEKPYIVTFVVVSYLLFVLKLGPAYMKTRPPVNLQNVLLGYNAIQVIFSIFLVRVGMKRLMRYGLIHETCLFDNEEFRKDILSGCYWYVIAKFTELLDTVFFVLRKKQNQVSFLHVYHHTFVVVMSWLLVKYGKTDDLMFVGTLNSFVHVWMYGYYALSVFPSLAKYLWWKKYMTTMQLVQFVLVLIHIPVNNLTSKCPPSALMLTFMVFNGLLFLYLFIDFYRKAYVKTGKDKVEREKRKGKEKADHTNDVDAAYAGFVKSNQAKWKR